MLLVCVGFLCTGGGVVVKEGELFEELERREEVWTAEDCAVEQPSPCTSVLGFG